MRLSPTRLFVLIAAAALAIGTFPRFALASDGAMAGAAFADSRLSGAESEGLDPALLHEANWHGGGHYHGGGGGFYRPYPAPPYYPPQRHYPPHYPSARPHLPPRYYPPQPPPCLWSPYGRFLPGGGCNARGCWYPNGVWSGWGYFAC